MAATTGGWLVNQRPRSPNSTVHARGELLRPATNYTIATQRCGCAGGCAQAQDQTRQGRQLSTLAPLRDLRARASDPVWARRAWVKALGLVREPEAGNPHVRFDERD